MGTPTPRLQEANAGAKMEMKMLGENLEHTLQFAPEAWYVVTRFHLQWIPAHCRLRGSWQIRKRYIIRIVLVEVVHRVHAAPRTIRPRRR